MAVNNDRDEDVFSSFVHIKGSMKLSLGLRSVPYACLKRDKFALMHTEHNSNFLHGFNIEMPRISTTGIAYVSVCVYVIVCT